MNEVHCPPSETDVEKAVHTPCTHRHSPDDKTIPTRPGGARRLWRKTGRPKRSGRTDDRLSLRPSLSPQLRAARRRSSAFRAIAIKLSIPHHAAILGRVPRSEEHTSELQSLMRISYAVFCLKKKK